jgi:hypothetical protein
MGQPRTERKLASILAADVALAQLRAYRRAPIHPERSRSTTGSNCRKQYLRGTTEVIE